MSDEELLHYGTPRHSGRYPWGSGDAPHQNSRSFLGYLKELRGQGLSEVDIAKAIGMTTTELRAVNRIAKNEQRKADEFEAFKLQEKGLSNVAIGKQMGLNESSVRSLLNPAQKDKIDILEVTAKMLKDEVAKKVLLDIGAGTENHLAISQTKLNTAVAMLKAEGYRVDTVKETQLGTGKKTKIKVLSAPGTEYTDIIRNRDKIKPISTVTEDKGRTYKVIEPPVPVSDKRVMVRYGPEGGADKDGVIELRRNVEDISLGRSRYAQVRIAVNGTHYLKGMAMYSDNMPDGVDMVFNTNKKDSGNKIDAMKPMKLDDPDNPFGSLTKPKYYKDAKGNEQQSPLNIVNEEGVWSTWSKRISSQVMSKQPTPLAKKQLALTLAEKREAFEEINSLTNPTIKKKLLQAFADNVDSSANHLYAAALPRLRHHVILPLTDIKEGEVYAPNYRNGEQVVLIRHPHGGKFEIPQLTVNNRNAEGRRLLENAVDAIGINPKVAQQLSGADFDGDTVLVIPNNRPDGPMKIAKPLEGLKDFDPLASYPKYDGMKEMDGPLKQRLMGDASNLITDMTIRGANDSEIARAVRYSMVVIDAEKHKLNHKLARKENGIAELKAKYQGRSNAGASTIISKANSPERKIPARKPRPAALGGPIDPATGKKVFIETGETYPSRKTNPKTGEVTVTEVLKTVRSKKMAEVEDAHQLSSGTTMEKVYADHANELKSLANLARKTDLETKGLVYSPSAKKVYAEEVGSLNVKLNNALKNSPLERRAQLLANAQVKQKTLSNPDMDRDDLKKVKSVALEEARRLTGARKQQVTFEDREWEAIQAGAITNNKLEAILNNADLDAIKTLATPRVQTGLPPAKLARAQAMIAAGYTQADIADQLGVSVSTLSKALS